MEPMTDKKPKTMAELLPGLSGILSRDTMQTLTAKKQPRPTMVQSRTSEKNMKPLTIAEMRADILALKVQSPRRFAQATTSTKKKIWNSSVKVDKKISHTADGQLKNNPVRKVLNFQPKTKVLPSSRLTIHPNAVETPKFPKPGFRSKKSIHIQARNTVRISGINNIPETPQLIKKPVTSRMTLANKENITSQPSIKKKPKLSSTKPLKHRILNHCSVPDTPLSNESWKSSCDASFLQKEKEIHDIEEKAKVISEEQTLEKLDQVSPPVSTPFKEYRNVKEYFNHSSELESSALYNDNTIMCFEEVNMNENKREESVIASLCDMLNKAKVSNTNKPSTELDSLLEVEKQTENNIRMLENGLQTLNKIKESQLKSLQYVRKLILDKQNGRKNSDSDHDKTLISKTKVTPKVEKLDSLEKSPMLGKPCSVIKSPLKSPSYRIPKKNLSLRKKVFHKSMPNVSNAMQTPNKDSDSRALAMYMKMKEQMIFLKTPVVKHPAICWPDSPAVTSHNLHCQLSKLFDES